MEKKGAHFVLVHGLGSGSWAWYKVRPILETSGYKVTCFNLKSAGTDRTSPESVRTFEEYNQPLIDFFTASDSDDKVILVGHSAGGLSVTAATHKFPDRIKAAVYLAATMLKHGFCTSQDFIDGVPEVLRGSERVRTDEERIEFNRENLYHMCSPEDFGLAMMLQYPGPTEAVVDAKFCGGDAVVDGVPRVYIKTLQDRVLKPGQQEAMIKRWPPSRVFDLDTDHNPNFSAPFMLSWILMTIAESGF